LECKGSGILVDRRAPQPDALAQVARELLEVADLRGDADLPRPEDDNKLWTARMQTAWDELRNALTAPQLAPEPRQSDMLTEALRFYAEPRNYRSPAGTPEWPSTNPMQSDLDAEGKPGVRARAALAAPRPERKHTDLCLTTAYGLRCTCGADKAERAYSAEGWKCKANRTADPPQDCDWPHCGCDPNAEKVIEALIEEGWGPSQTGERTYSAEEASELERAAWMACYQWLTEGEHNEHAREMRELAEEEALRHYGERKDGEAGG
jgi:hypothetical protein